MEIKPIYVSYQQAKLLKEKGFDESCVGFYSNNNPHYNDGYFHLNTVHPFTDETEKRQQSEVCILAPEQWMVIEWFRLKYGILSSTIFINKDFYAYVLHKRKGGWDSKFFKTPQEATSAAIDYVLTNLI